MSYSTITDILFDLPKNEVINLTNDEKRTADLINLEVADDACVLRVNKAIEDADNEIDIYLRGRYTLPLTAPIPKALTKISKDISIYNLFCRRYKIDIPFREVYLSRIKELVLIQRGEINLDIADTTVDNSGYYVVNKTSDDRVFSKDNLDLY